MRSIIVLAAALLLGIVGGKLYFEAHVLAASGAEPTTISMVQTYYDGDGSAIDHKSVTSYVEGFERTQDDIRGDIKHRLLRTKGDDGKWRSVHALPELGVRMTTGLPGDPSVRTVNPDRPCGGDKELRNEILGIEVYGSERVAAAAQPGEPDMVSQIWQAPTLGCATVTMMLFDRYPDGRRATRTSIVLVGVKAGVPDDVFAVDANWKEVSTGAAHVLIEASRTSPAEAEIWRAQPAVQAYLQRIDSTYYRNRRLFGID